MNRLRAAKQAVDRAQAIALERFVVWFCSGGGVWQTTFAIVAVVAAEFADRNLDPHAFILMAVLTVYSAVTQPALAHAGQVSAGQMEAMLSRLEEMERRLLSKMEQTEQN